MRQAFCPADVDYTSFEFSRPSFISDDQNVVDYVGAQRYSYWTTLLCERIFYHELESRFLHGSRWVRQELLATQALWVTSI